MAKNWISNNKNPWRKCLSFILFASLSIFFFFCLNEDDYVSKIRRCERINQKEKKQPELWNDDNIIGHTINRNPKWIVLHLIWACIDIRHFRLPSGTWKLTFIYLSLIRMHFRLSFWQFWSWSNIINLIVWFSTGLAGIVYTGSDCRFVHLCHISVSHSNFNVHSETGEKECTDRSVHQ